MELLLVRAALGTQEEMGQRIFNYFLQVASGGQTKSEMLNLGRHEFIPWNIGITG